MQYGELSFARVGVDERWTWVSPDEHPCLGLYSGGFVDFFHDDDDGLFYALRGDASIYTLDLNSPPNHHPIVVVEKIMAGELVPPREQPAAMYILRAPWGDILQVWRWKRYIDLMEEEETPSSSEELADNLNDDDVDLEPIMGGNDELYPYLELRTTEIQVFRVDLDQQKLVEISLGEHALFLGYNATMCLSTKDYPVLKPNCAYITDDSLEYVNNYPNSWREIGIWDMETNQLQSLACAETSLPWLNCPSPVWIKPSLC
uniref:KIB1-4 beta-propeller domain-containing protein n=1 Tax=Leersia perrieri TaxID=77586 RepID=A0A0D9XML7_9ORYZ